jgi:hypothetical protein
LSSIFLTAWGRNWVAMAIDQRKYERIAPRGNAFAALGRDYSKVGRIKDISLGGLAFEYISASGAEADASQIDIFLVGDVFHLYNIPCEVVYDIPHSNLLKNIESINVSSAKRCGVQFTALSEDDRAQMRLFLEYQARDSSA